MLESFQAEAEAAGGREESLALCFLGFGDKLERKTTGWLGGRSPLAVPWDFTFLVPLCQWHPHTLLGVGNGSGILLRQGSLSRSFLALFTALCSLCVPRSGESSELPFCLIQLRAPDLFFLTHFRGTEIKPVLLTGQEGLDSLPGSFWGGFLFFYYFFLFACWQNFLTRAGSLQFHAGEKLDFVLRHVEFSDTQ